MSDARPPTSTLILLRHGESQWNARNLFTGWVDVDLSERGLAEALRGGELLAESGLLPDVVHTSLLRRAIRTANIALDACDRSWIPVRRNWRLNERHYGALQGKDKAHAGTMPSVRAGYNRAGAGAAATGATAASGRAPQASRKAAMASISAGGRVRSSASPGGTQITVSYRALVSSTR